MYTLALERPVGVLFSENRNPEILYFREACNKVLHADRVDLETTGGTGDTRGALTGNLILRGRLYGTEWRAELDLKQYALSALTLSP